MPVNISMFVGAFESNGNCR